MSKLLYVIGFFAFSVNVNANDQVKDIAKDVGYRSCLSTVSDIEDFFGNKVSYGSWSFWARENPDEQIFNSTLELTYGDGIQLVDFTVAPTKDGQCSFVYTRTFYSPKSCLATTKNDYMSKAEFKGEINKSVSGFSEKGGVKWLLTPAGSGCLVQKKEIVFRSVRQDS
ncbi:MAG TPA: hypothetical protein ENJ13_09375 [Chromatiales bacterium]|nr:hypothetical protein [Chromatiales bacterium]